MRRKDTDFTCADFVRQLTGKLPQKSFVCTSFRHVELSLLSSIKESAWKITMEVMEKEFFVLFYIF